MKTSHKLVGAALLAAVGAGLAIPSATKADFDGTDASGKGTVEFTTDTSTNPTNLPPGESTGDPLTAPSQNPNPGTLKVVSVTDIDFDSHAIVANDSEKTYDALPFTDGNQTTAHFVRFQDVRSDVASNYYTVKAALTSQFTNTAMSSTLDGATLTYKNISLVTGTNAATLPTDAVQEVTSLEFADDGSKAQVFVESNEDGKGFGVFEIMFDTTANAQADTYDGVTLTVPGDNVLKAGQYQAEITWTIADAN
ncbi:WxL domain-containing protein [Enterococcus sp. BWB1-3]|uniref:WxL domain-containing protein n=1 Tax=unclassified Enterococcus TaxID=2608891 RepID=UPI0019223142|nr:MULTISPECIES: WxL domain-containing protein [unclassified Enterococcus]MBL1230303.1 WxL domain-containing protein [Enterococcus sp. BWB1-3]MCB5951344.1 WxL domain-containing protein [Enterococcus sp. BWT-B8]MCB5956353.1 WxL domain-containing protein [Enterococcus sp. CWB-B31]